MTRRPIIATALAVSILAFTPIWAFTRLGGEFEFTAVDGLLLVVIAAWVVIARAVLERNDLVADLGRSIASPRAHAAALIDESFFGVGQLTSDPVPTEWHRLQAPAEDDDLVLAPPALDIVRSAVVDEDRPLTPVSYTHLTLPTTPYV